MAITYPVPEDSRWSIYHISTGEINPHNRPWPRAGGLPIEGLDPDLVPLMEVSLDDPVYDPATHRLVTNTPVVDVDANTHTHSRSAVPRDQADIDADAEREAAKAVYSALKAHTGTNDERQTRLENAVAYMLKNIYGAS